MRSRAAACVFLSIAALACHPTPTPTELTAAVERGDAAGVERMLAAHADPDATGDDPPRTALSIAAARGDVRTVRALLRHHADANRHDPPRGGEPATVGATPLGWAAAAGHVDVLHVLLASGARPDGDAGTSESPLAAAAERCDLAVVDALLAGYANVDGTGADATGYPPLVVAAESERPRCVERLLAAHARVDRRDVLGMTALCTATAKENVALVRMLLAAHADPLAANRAGWTPAFTAQWHRRDDVLALYRAAGVTDFEMHTPPPMPPSGFGVVAVPALEVRAGQR